MKNFNNNNSFNRENRGGFERRQFGDRNRERPQMHEAICADCGKRCEVPFKPSNEKPVYCNQCFQNHKGKSFEKPRFQDNNKEQFDILNAKLDRIIKILTPAVSVAPVIPEKREKKEAAVKAAPKKKKKAKK